MKRGTTNLLAISISGIDNVNDVTSIIWRFSIKGADEDNEELTKTYPADVEYNSELNQFLIPFTQEDTLKLQKGLVEYEAQINFTNKSVTKSNIVIGMSDRTLGTTLIDDNYPYDVNNTVTMKLEDSVVFARDGVTFTPHITVGENTVILSWTNNGDEDNPNPVNIKGEQGIQGDKGDKGDTGEKGDKGDKGDTPVKGTDYWTPEDIESMETDIENYVNPLLDLKADKSTTYTKTEVDGALSSKANSNDVYTKTQTDTLLSDKADSSNVYTKSDVYNKSETNTLLNNKANSTDVYTKSQTDTLLSAKADTSTTYTKTETDSLLNSKANSSDVYLKTETYSKTETDTLLSAKADSSSVYTKTETDTLLSNKANSSDVYTKTESDTLLSAKANSTDVYTKTESNTLLNAKANTSDVYTKTQADTLLDGKVNVSDFEDLEADVESVMLYVGYDKEVAGLCADFENNTFTRIAGSVGKSAGTDFDSWNLFGGRRRCNVADDGTINAWYGDNDFVEDGSNGQVMVYQPKFYYRVEPLKLEAQSTGIGYHLKKANYYVSDTQKAGFKLHPAFIDKNGNEIDYILFSAYEGCLYDTSAGAYITDDSQVMNTSEDKLSSIANVKPCSGNTQNLTRPNVEVLAQNRGTNWHGETIQFASVNQLLCAIEYASFNFQTAIGQGVISYEGGNGNEASNTGATSTLGNASGQATETTHVSSDNVTTIDTTAGKLSVSYRGVENIWGNVWKFEHGVNIWGDGTMNGGQPYICSDYNFAESKNSDNYVGAGFTVANTNGYVKYFGYSEDFDYLFIASEVGGTSSLPVGDYFYITSNLNAYRVPPLGGSWTYGSTAGGFFWSLTYGVGARVRNIGCRLAYTPTR